MTAKEVLRQGRLGIYFDIGTEGMCWTLHELNPPPGEMGMHALGNGDRLIVRELSGAVLFDGTVELDYTLNLVPASYRPENKIQRVGQTTVRGLQAGVDPHDWLAWFRDELPCEFLPR